MARIIKADDIRAGRARIVRPVYMTSPDGDPVIVAEVEEGAFGFLFLRRLLIGPKAALEPTASGEAR